MTGPGAVPTVMFAGGGTGGHLYPGLAIARALARVAPEVRSVFIGARRGIERDVLPREPFAYHLLDLHPLYRPAVWRNWRTVAGGVGAWRDLGPIVRREQPRLVVGTGGYASGVALGYALAHGIPIAEQVADSHPGLTARWFARYCREVYLGYPEAVPALSRRRGPILLDTGNPIDPPPDPPPGHAEARATWMLPPEVDVVVLVFGGSQGARALNAAVDEWIARGIPDRVAVIWATGPTHYAMHAGREAPRVRVRPYLSPIAAAYAAADLAVTRAGAMTTAELCAWGIPMVLVPLPTAAADHQTANAKALAAAGAAVHVPQDALSAEGMGRLIASLTLDAGRRGELAAAARRRGRPRAAEDIARRILSVMQLT